MPQFFHVSNTRIIMRTLISILLLCLTAILSGCKHIEYVPVEHVRTDTAYVSNISRARQRDCARGGRHGAHYQVAVRLQGPHRPRHGFQTARGQHPGNRCGGTGADAVGEGEAGHRRNSDWTDWCGDYCRRCLVDSKDAKKVAIIVFVKFYIKVCR